MEREGEDDRRQRGVVTELQLLQILGALRFRYFLFKGGEGVVVDVEMVGMWGTVEVLGVDNISTSFIGSTSSSMSLCKLEGARRLAV